MVAEVGQDDAGMATVPDSQNPATMASEAATADGTSGYRSQAAPMAVGEAIGRFTITGVLGRGGMGVVYAARDPKLGRLLAVKVLHRSVDDADERAQALLLREARAMAQVSHPNLVTIYDVGHDDGRAFIAMELIDGQTLGQWRRDTDAPWQQVLAHYAQAGEGLLAAHDEGLVHRDFKPSNVLRSDKGRVAVVDFGLARAVATAEIAASGPPDPRVPPSTEAVITADPRRTHAATQQDLENLTRTGALVGTPAYMSPEQFRGEPTDARTDQFAFCVALWEALFGVRPFEASSPVALMFAVIEGKRHEAPAGTQVPQTIVDALQRGLSPDRAHRFGGMRALLEALSAAPAQGAPAQSKPTRLWLGALAAAGAGVAALVVWAAQPEVHDTAPPQSQVVAEPEVGMAALDGYVTRKDFRSTATLWRAAEQDFARACEQAPSNTRYCAAQDFAHGQALLEEHQPAAAEAQMRGAAQRDPAWALPHIGLASALRLQAQLPEALAASIAAQGLAPDLWIAVASAAATHVAADRLGDAIDEYRRALQLAPDHSVLLADLALVYHAQHIDSQAEHYAAAALAQDPQSMSALLLLAERALEAGDGTKALGLADRAVAVGAQSVTAWLARGDALLVLGRNAQAAECFERAVGLLAVDPDHGAPAERLAAVQQAVAQGELPPPRYTPEQTAADEPLGERSRGATAADPPPASVAPQQKHRSKSRSKNRAKQRSKKATPSRSPRSAPPL